MSFELQPFEIKVRKRSKLGQYWAIMGYLFGLIREIDPRLRYAFDTFTLMGLLWTLKITCQFTCTTLNGFRVHIWSRLWKTDLKKRYGEWAVITGATDGLGLEYARQFASRGHSLILVGRNPNKLETVKNELARKIGENRVVTVQADFSSANLETFKRITEEINEGNRDIGILVNNAGVMYKSPNVLLDQDVQQDWDQIMVNCTSLTLMTRTCLPGMVKRKRGLIINLSSLAAYQPLKFMGVYSASKKYVEYFSQTLQSEYKNKNIDVQILTPSYIATKMTQWSSAIQKANFVFPDAKTFVQSAISTIGYSSNTTGFWSHGMQMFFYDYFVPNWMYRLTAPQFISGLDSSKIKK